jgi:hypothetical protein
MLVCDQAIREEGTGKVSLIGIFENIASPSFPLIHPTLSVYVKLTDAEGKYRLRLELVQLETATIAATGEADIAAPDRMGSFEINFSLGNLPFPLPGLYEFRLLANGRYLGSKSLNVVASKPA